jgi:hypothetical protein
VLLAAAPAKAGTLEVHWLAPHLWVKAEAAPLAAVLNAIESRTGIVIVGAQLLSETVSVTFEGVPLDEAVARLVRGRSYFMEAGDGGDAVTRVVILRGRQSLTSPPGVEVDGVANPEDRLAVLGEAMAEPGATREALLAMAVESRDPDVQPAALDVLGHLGTREARLTVLSSAVSPDPRERVAALRVLATVDSDEAMPLLGSALADGDVDVRSAALDLVATLEGPQPLRLLDRSLADPEPTVRLAAVELLARRADADSLALVRKALGDGNEAVRLVAETLLRQAGKGTDESAQ